jgi:hypothetical protein
VGVMALLGVLVLLPLAREYADLRRSFALSRLGALGTTSLVLPALAVAVMLALPLAGHPMLQWATIVVTTFLVYSLAARAILASASSAETAPSRTTRG